MAEIRCSSCGAAGEGLVCLFCGAGLGEIIDPAAEAQALSQYHGLVREADGAKLQRLLRHGYLPKHEAALIDAGMFCIPLLDDDLNKERGGTNGDEGEDIQPSDAAAMRMAAIASQLAITGGSPEAVRAGKEFRSHLRRYRRGQFWLVVFGITLFVVLPIGLVVLILLLVL